MTDSQYDVDVAIVGAGIAGATLAARLSTHCRVALIDRDIRALPGSTGHAPGIVAQLNTVPALTELAKRSVAHYRSVPGGFDVVGGLEVTISNGTGGMDWLNQRAALAYGRGLPHKLLSVVEAQRLSPFVRDDAEGAIYYPGDGTATARVIAHANQDAAKEFGAQLVDGDVLGIAPIPNPLLNGAQGYTLALGSGATLTARRVVVATGVWAGQLAPTLAASVVAFAHPYAYAARRPKRDTMPPFVRFPCHKVYARDHGERDGLGTYAHDPVSLRLEATRALPSAYAPWVGAFDHSVQSGLELLPAATAAQFGTTDGATARTRAQPATASVLATKDVPYAFTGLFTISPDGLPLVGPLGDGLYAAAGCWVTHAAGAMGLLADQILADMGLADPVEKDQWLRAAVDPRRFRGRSARVCEHEAREQYVDIWNKKKQDEALARRQATIVEGVWAKM
jgi:sarcosine oxidase